MSTMSHDIKKKDWSAAGKIDTPPERGEGKIYRIITETKNAIELGDLKKASILYEEIVQEYRELPKEAQRGVYEECYLINEQISMLRTKKSNKNNRFKNAKKILAITILLLVLVITSLTILKTEENMLDVLSSLKEIIGSFDSGSPITGFLSKDSGGPSGHDLEKTDMTSQGDTTIEDISELPHQGDTDKIIKEDADDSGSQILPPKSDNSTDSDQGILGKIKEWISGSGGGSRGGAESAKTRKESELRKDIENAIKKARDGTVSDPGLFEELINAATPSESTDFSDAALLIQGELEIGKPAEIIKAKKRLGGGYDYEIVRLLPPKKKEQEVIKGTLVKEIIVDSDAPIHLYNVKAKTSLPNYLRSPRLYHETEGKISDVTDNESYNVRTIDQDGDGIAESMDWVVPRLSQQIFYVGEGASTGNILISALRSQPSRVGANTNFTVSLIIYNKGDFTAYNLTLNETNPLWTVVDTGGGSRIGSSLNFSPITLYPDGHVRINYTITSNASGSGSFRWYVRYQNSSGNLFSINENSPAIINITSSEPAYQFNLTPAGFNIYNETLFEIGVKSIGSAQISAGSSVIIRFPDGWNVTSYGGGVWNSTNRSITYTLPSAIAVGSSNRLNFTAILNRSSANDLTISGSRSATYLTQNYTDTLSPSWSIYSSGSKSSSGCTITISNSTSKSHTLQNTWPAGGINPRITDINLYVLWSRALTSGNTLVVNYDDVDVKDDNLAWKELFNISDTSGGAGANFIGWDYNIISTSNPIGSAARDFLMQFSVTASDSRSGNRACGAVANLTVSSISYRWNYTVESWDSQEVFARGFGIPELAASPYDAPTAVGSSKTFQVNLTLVNTGNDTAVNISLKEIITSMTCSSEPFIVGNISQGQFSNYTYSSADKTIIWSGLELQPNENASVSFNLTSPMCFNDELFTNALNATVSYNDLRQIRMLFEILRDITVNAGNRALITHSISPSEITSGYETEVAITLLSNGEENVSSIDLVNITLPSGYSADADSISDGGSYNATTRVLNWSNLGSLEIGSTKQLRFNITADSAGERSLGPTTVYQDIYGSRTRSDSLSVTAIVLTKSASFNPNPSAPSESSTLTVSITNPYADAITDLTIVPEVKEGWSVSPSSDSVSSIAPYGSTSKQFLVTPSDTSGIFQVNVSIDYTDPNSILVSVNTSSSLEIASRPNLVIIREMPPYTGTSQTMMVRFYIYNDGNAMAYNANLTEYLSPAWRTSGTITALDGGVVSGNTTFWSLGNISAGNYSLVRYSASQPTTATYAFNSTARWQNVEGSSNYTNEGPNRTIVKAGGTYQFDLRNRTNKIGQPNLLIFNASNIGTATITNLGWPSIYIPSEWNVEGYGDGLWIPSERIITYPEAAVSQGTSVMNNFTINTTTTDYFVFVAYGQNSTSRNAGSGQLTGSPPNYAGTYTNTTADDNSYWWFGRLDTGGVSAYAELTYNISSLGISRFLVTNLTFTLVYCHDGSTAITSVVCDGTPATGSPIGTQDVEIYNYSSGQWLDIGDLRTNDGGSEVWDYYGVSGIVSDFISTGNMITIRYQMEYSNSNAGGGQDSFMVLDYAAMNITYIEKKTYQENLFVLTEAGIVNISIIDPYNFKIIYQGDLFNVTANITARQGNVYNSQAQILISALLSLVDSDATHSTGDLLENQYTNTSWNLSADSIGIGDITVKTTAASGTGTQHQIYVNITNALQIGLVNPSQAELEPGDNLSNISVRIQNLARTTHDITTSISIYNSTGALQSFGPLSSESITNTGIASGQNGTALFSNSSMGYPVPVTAGIGDYIIRATSIPDSLDSSTGDAVLRIVYIGISSYLNTSSVLPTQSANHTINISNGWGSAVSYNVSRINISRIGGGDVTEEWSINPSPPSTQLLAGVANGSISFIIAPPSEIWLALPGNYTINSTIAYLDPNGRQKLRNTAVNITILPMEDAYMTIISYSQNPIGLDSEVFVNITNAGNVNITNANLSLLMGNLGWSISPSTRLINVSVGLTALTGFNVSVPATASLGTAPANATLRTTVYYNSSTEINITENIFTRSVIAKPAEVEPYDYFSLNATIENTYFRNISIDANISILDPLSAVVAWTPSSQVGIAANSSNTTRNWSNILANSSVYGTYTARVNVTYGSGASNTNYTTFRIVLVNVTNLLTPSAVSLFGTTQLNVSVFNNFSSDAYFTTNVEIWDSSGNNDTTLWTIQTVPSLMRVPGFGSNTSSISLTTPSTPLLVQAGYYTVRAIVNYTDPNGNPKLREKNSSLYVSPYLNLSAEMDVPDMPLDAVSEIIVTINNTGNDAIPGINLSLSIFNSSGSRIYWSVSPDENQTGAAAFSSIQTFSFLVNVPAEALLGNYTANMSIDFDGTEREFIYLLRNFSVTQDIEMYISHYPSELEPGDSISWIEVNASNINDAEVYDLTSWIDILDQSNNNMAWGPNETEKEYIFALVPGESEIRRWDNSSYGYSVPANTAYGLYKVKASTNVSPIDAVRTKIANTLSIVEVNYTAVFVPDSLGIGQTALLNVSIWSGFTPVLSFNVSNIKIYRDSVDVTNQWSIWPETFAINVDTWNSNTISTTSPGSALQALPGSYNLNFTINYTDPNGVSKQKKATSTITILSVENISITIFSNSQNPIGLDSEIFVNVSNTGNVNITNANVSLVIADLGWTVMPSYRQINVSMGLTALTGFNISVPASALLGVAPVNITLNASNLYTSSSEFYVTENIFTRFVSVNLSEIEPGTQLEINTTIENDYILRPIDSIINISILDYLGSEMSWTPVDNQTTLANSTNTTVRFSLTVPDTTAIGNYTVLINTTYGVGAFSSNTTRFTVSTIEAEVDSLPASVDWNQTSVINISLNNTWFSAGFNVNVTLHSIINSSGEDARSVWNVDSFIRNAWVGARDLNHTEMRVNTSGGARGTYNFTIFVNYTDPNTNRKISRNYTVSIGVGLARVNAYYTLPPIIATEEGYYLNATVANTGGYDLTKVNISLYIENSTKNYWFTPSVYTLNDLNVSRSNSTLTMLFVPKTVAPGRYNASIQVNYTDQDGQPQTSVFRQEFTILMGIDVNILVNGREYALVRPGQAANITINVLDSTDSGVVGANLNLALWRFDGNQTEWLAATGVGGNYTFSIQLNESEGGYYVRANVTTSSFENESKELVFLADDNKSVLIVADNEATSYGTITNDAMIASAISSITEISISQTRWYTATNGSPTTSNMSSHDAVIWSLGDHMLTGVMNNTSEVDQIIGYLGQGGGFMLESSGLAYNIHKATYSTDPRVLTQVLKVNFPTDNPQMIGTKNFETVKDYLNYPLIDGYAGELNDTVSNTKLYKDKIYPNASLYSKSFLAWQGTNSSAGVFFDERSDLGTNGSKTLYLPFSLDGISESERSKLVKNSLMWLMRTKLGVFAKPNASEYIVYPGGSDEAQLMAYVKDHDSEDVLGLTNGATINATLHHPNGTITTITLAAKDNYYVGFTNFSAAGYFRVVMNVSRIGNLDSYGTATLRVTETGLPSINLISPEPNWLTSVDTVVFIYNTTDQFSGILNCQLVLDGSINSTNWTVSEGIPQNFSIFGLSEGDHYWYVNCTDSSPSQNMNSSEMRLLRVDRSAPSIILGVPGDGSWDTDGSVQMSYTPYDVGLSMCRLWGNFSGEFALNQTEPSPTSGTINYFDAISLFDGHYGWNVWCNDSVGLSGWAENNYSFSVDTSPPSVNVLIPKNNSEWNTSSIVVFEYSVSDFMTSIANCSLIINGTINGNTNTSIIPYAVQSFTRQLEFGKSYSWSVNCTDSNGHENSSDSYQFHIEDRTNPVVELLSPPVYDNDPDGNVTFQFRVTDNHIISNCSLYTNLSGWSEEDILFGVSNYTITNFTLNGIPENTSFIWNVLCIDNFGNIDWGDANRTIVIRQPTEIYDEHTLGSLLEVIGDAPNVSNVGVTSPITLNADGFVPITCNGTAYDQNGFGDIASASATFYFPPETSSSGPDNYTNHYTNSSCEVISSGTYTKEYMCGFHILFYSNNGTWTCNISASDLGGQSGSELGLGTIEPLFAIEVTPVIDYGELDIGLASASDEVVTIRNIGNMMTDLAIRGYGASLNDGLSMNCSDYGNISIEYQKFSLSSDVAFGDMSYTLSTGYIDLGDFDLPKQNDESTNSTRNVYWKLMAPIGAKGTCRGTVIFSALG